MLRVSYRGCGRPFGLALDGARRRTALRERCWLAAQCGRVSDGYVCVRMGWDGEGTYDAIGVELCSWLVGQGKARQGKAGTA